MPARGARLAGKAEVPGAEASCRSRPKAGGLPPFCSGFRGRRRIFSRGAADRARHFGRGPRRAGIQAPRQLPSPALFCFRRCRPQWRGKNSHVDRHPAAATAARDFPARLVTPEPFALEERHRVFACDRKALMRGVRAGMAVAAALALAPRLRIAQRDPAAETEALLGVAGWAAQFTPGVALEFPDACCWKPQAV